LEQSAGKKPQKSSASREVFFWAQALVFALSVLVLVNIFVGRVSGVSGSSMLPTLTEGDQLIVQVAGYDRYSRGDIIVIAAEEEFPGEPLVKRIIGIAGDTIDFDFDKGVLILNGEEVYEPYIKESMRKFGMMDYPLVVPDGHVFVMGDNRNGSTDSRSIGALPTEDVIGRVVFRIWPLKSFGTVK